MVVAFLFLAMSCENKDLFIVEGKINADSGTLFLDPFYHHDYYLDPTQLQAEVKNGKFHFTGSIQYPMGFTISYEDSFRSRLFVLEPGNQEMIVDLDQEEVALIDNASMIEYRNSYLKSYEEVRQSYDDFYNRRDGIYDFYQREVPDSINLLLEKQIKTIYQKSDSTLLNYIINNPDSYLALWKLIEIYSFDGYNPVYSSAFENLSPTIKKSLPGTVLGSKITRSKILSKGNTFPALPVVDIYFDSTESIIPNDRKYILLDFWYSSCRPCIAQFPELISIYNEFRNRGFEIIGISSDRVEVKDKWLEAIVKYELPWHQYLDMDATWCKKMGINRFPTNYLLDGNGMIVARDLRPVEIKDFLKANL